jgi:hypothetical protein
MRPLAIITLALLAGACTSSPTTTSGSSDANPATAAFKYATCIRDHGVSDFPDPQVVTTPGGGVGIRQAVPASAGLSPRFQSAQKACRAILPLPGNGAREHQRPSKQAILAFARCLRSHGISDFPDPNAQGELTLQMISAAGVNLKAPAFRTAAKACVGVTHGEITLAEVAQAVNGPH